MRSVASAEIFVLGNVVDEGEIIASTFKRFLQIKLELYAAVDSRDLFTSLSMCHTPEDKSIASDVQLMGYNFETHLLNRLIWLPGRENPADALTKPDSPLAQTFQLMPFDGTKPLDLSKMEYRKSTQSLG